MQVDVRKALYGAQSRYFTETEEAEIRAYAESLLVALPSVRELEAQEKLIIDDALSALMARHPELARNHGADSELRGRRDMTFVYRYAVLGMLLSDPDFVRDKLAIWMKTIVTALMPKEPMIYGYKRLVDAAITHLGAERGRRLAPYIELIITELEHERSDA
jgi:hypothetical protein